MPNTQHSVYLTEQSLDESHVDMAVAAAQQAAALRAAESRAQAAMMVEAVEDRAYEAQLLPDFALLQ